MKLSEEEIRKLTFQVISELGDKATPENVKENVRRKVEVLSGGEYKFEKGEIKLNGLIWGAKPDQDEELEKDSECEVIRIEGATAVVKKV